MIPKQSEPVYLLDTDIIKAIDLGNPRVSAKLAQIPRSQVSISIITVAEILQGWLGEINKTQSKVKGNICWAYDMLAEAQHDLSNFNIAKYTDEADAVFRAFPSSVKRVGPNDCRIAATAIAHNLIVVTRNTRDFARIPNVKFEDWTAD